MDQQVFSRIVFIGLILVCSLFFVGCEEEPVRLAKHKDRMKNKVLSEVYEHTLQDGTRCVVVGDYYNYAAISCNWKIQTTLTPVTATIELR